MVMPPGEQDLFGGDLKTTSVTLKMTITNTNAEIHAVISRDTRETGSCQGNFIASLSFLGLTG